MEGEEKMILDALAVLMHDSTVSTSNIPPAPDSLVPLNATYQNKAESTAPDYSTSTPAKRPKSYAQKACASCKNSHVACDSGRPCQRCIRLNRADSCIDAFQRKRGRPTNASLGLSSSTSSANQTSTLRKKQSRNKEILLDISDGGSSSSKTDVKAEIVRKIETKQQLKHLDAQPHGATIRTSLIAQASNSDISPQSSTPAPNARKSTKKRKLNDTYLVISSTTMNTGTPQSISTHDPSAIISSISNPALPSITIKTSTSAPVKKPRGRPPRANSDTTSSKKTAAVRTASNIPLNSAPGNMKNSSVPASSTDSTALNNESQPLAADVSDLSDILQQLIKGILGSNNTAGDGNSKQEGGGGFGRHIGNINGCEDLNVANINGAQDDVLEAVRALSELLPEDLAKALSSSATGNDAEALAAAANALVSSLLESDDPPRPVSPPPKFHPGSTSTPKTRRSPTILTHPPQLRTLPSAPLPNLYTPHLLSTVPPLTSLEILDLHDPRAHSLPDYPYIDANGTSTTHETTGVGTLMSLNVEDVNRMFGEGMY